MDFLHASIGVFRLKLSLKYCISEKGKCADVFSIRHRIRRQATQRRTQLRGTSCSETRWPCSPWQQWCRQPALGYRQPSTGTNNQQSEKIKKKKRKEKKKKKSKVTLVAQKPRVEVTPFPQTYRTVYTISPPQDQ